ncbi:hypothetical protein CSPAE12_01314 [Colletotrichum incanum]|nr:hypothetical protein CSPAE12_01314 [Colletotrichum incanum]
MTGKGHCRADITKEGSEFEDFYDLHHGSGTDSDDGGEKSKGLRKGRFIALDKKTRRLAAGRILSHRRVYKLRIRWHIMEDDQSTTDTLLEQIYSPVVERKQKKELAGADKRDPLFNKQLATLRPGDQQALMHLPLPQQRALVAKGKKQQERWKRERMTQEIKRQLKPNP